MRIKSEDIKVKINYPENSYYDENIVNKITEWILNQQIDVYGKENLLVAYPIWIRIKEIESTGATYEEAKIIAIQEYMNK